MYEATLFLYLIQSVARTGSLLTVPHDGAVHSVIPIISLVTACCLSIGVNSCVITWTCTLFWHLTFSIVRGKR